MASNVEGATRPTWLGVVPSSDARSQLVALVAIQRRRTDATRGAGAPSRMSVRSLRARRVPDRGNPRTRAHSGASTRESRLLPSTQKTTACAKGNSRREANKNVRTPAAGTYSRILIFKVKKRVTFPPHLSPNEDRWNVGTCRPTLVYAYVARARAYATTFSARTPRRTA